jgi:hypothetical protein
MNDPETLWLNVTNIALGAVTIICLLVFGREVIREVVELVRARSRARVAGSAHELVLSDLGVTMADGGEEIDEHHVTPKPPAGDDLTDPPNIFRSEN